MASVGPRSTDARLKLRLALLGGTEIFTTSRVQPAKSVLCVDKLKGGGQARGRVEKSMFRMDRDQGATKSGDCAQGCNLCKSRQAIRLPGPRSR